MHIESFCLFAVLLHPQISPYHKLSYISCHRRCVLWDRITQKQLVTSAVLWHPITININAWCRYWHCSDVTTVPYARYWHIGTLWTCMVSCNNRCLNMQDLPVSFLSWPGTYTPGMIHRGLASAWTLHEATVNIESWSCGRFSRCAMNVTGILLLETTKSQICTLYAHHRTLETLQDVYWGFKFNVVRSLI